MLQSDIPYDKLVSKLQPSPAKTPMSFSLRAITGLLQSICHIGQNTWIATEHRLKTALEAAHEMTITWITPLEVTPCLHVVMCGQNEITNPSFQEITTVTIALLTLILAFMDWHIAQENHGNHYYVAR